MARLRSLLPLAVTLLLAAFVFFTGLDWGLPSRDADRYLFASSQPWTGAQILALLEPDATTSPTRGADVDASPILDRSKPVLLNDTDAKRAAIVQRYRLMSGQPDEFIQFKALAEMAARPGVQKLDPRLYQYGGLWIYPVGTLLKACSLVGLVELRADRAYYLDHPEAFGRFYVVARAYSATWGLIAVASIYWLARRTTNDRMLAAIAACAFAILPVVTTAAHEAKPHLAGATLVLLAAIAATKHVETGRRRWAILAAIACGAAPAMVLSMVWAVAMLPVFVFVSWHGFPTRVKRITGWKPVPRTLWLVSMAFLTYALTNPFVIWNALFHREMIASNLGNSTAMYGVRDLPKAIVDATRIFSLGATPVVLVGGIVATAILLVARCVSFSRPACGARRSDTCEGITTPQANGPRAGRLNEGASVDSCRPLDLAPSHVPLVLLAGPTLLTLGTFVALAAGKPAEYARFSLLVAAFAVLAILSVVNRRWIDQHPKLTATFSMLAVSVLAWFGFVCVLLLLVRLDSHTAAELLAQDYPVSGSTQPANRSRIGVAFEPAPWSSPPMSLFDREIWLLPSIDFATLSQHVDIVVFPRQLDGIATRSDELGPVGWQRSSFVVTSVHGDSR